MWVSEEHQAEFRKNMPSTQWSWNRYRDWKTCQYLFYFSHIARMPVMVPIPQIEIGIEIHHIIYDLSQIKKDNPTVDMNQEILKQVLKIRGKYSEDSLEFIQICLASFKHFYQPDPRFVTKSEFPLSITRDFDMVTWFDPAVWFRAKIDLMEVNSEGAFCLTDWKTGNKLEGLDQLKLYLSLLITTVFKEAQFTGYQLKIVHLYNRVIERAEVTRIECVKFMESFVSELALYAAQDKIIPSPGKSKCGDCMHRLICPSSAC